MKLRPVALLVLCLFALVATAAVNAADITVLKQRVLFDNNNFQEKTSTLGVNFFRTDPAGQYQVCVKPNVPATATTPAACPVFKTGVSPFCTTVTNPGGGNNQQRFELPLVSRPGEPPRRGLRNCAVTYSIELLTQPQNYFWRPEIGIAYGLK